MLPATPTNRFVGAADNTSRPYKSGNHPYKSAICSHSLVGVAGQTAPTNAHEPPLEMIYVVVITAKIQADKG